LDNHAAKPARHRADAGDGADGFFREHVGYGSEQVRRPRLMGRRADADDGDGQWRGP